MRFSYWRNEPALMIWQLASMLHGVDPHELGDIVVDDAGNGLDMSIIQNSLIEATRSGEFLTVCNDDRANPTVSTVLTKPSVVLWLRKNKYLELADALDRSPSCTVRNKYLFDKYRLVWPTIEEDFKRYAENGLHEAKVGHGRWDECKALAWAGRNGCLVESKGAGVNLSSTWYPKSI